MTPASELSLLAGVTDVQIDLVVDGTSTLRVTTDKELTDDEVVVALQGRVVVCGY